MSINPVEIPTGAVRYNTDSNKMEVYIGDTWMEVAVSSPNLDGGTRGVFLKGHVLPAGTVYNTADFVNIASTGNAIDFGDTFTGAYECSGCSDSHGGLEG